MKIEINSSLFNDFVKKSKDIKTDSILIDATDVVELVKCDLENQIATEVIAQVIEPGSIILPKEVFPLIKNDELMTITDMGITVGTRTIETEILNGRDYPKIEDNFKYNVFDLSDKELKHLLQVEHAISQDKTKPILNGIRIEKNKFITIDGYRLCERVGNFETELPITISNYKMLKGLKGQIKATCSDRYIKYQVNNYNYCNRLIEGDFIQVDKLKPKEHNTVVEVDKKEFEDILKAMEKVSAKVKNSLVKLSIRDNLIHLSAEVKEDEKKKMKAIKLEDSIKCITSGEYLDIAFNSRYLLEAIKDMNNIKMSFTNNVNPVIIEDVNKYELVLPVRIAVI
ncbi:DNA polymerase III subunit beta [Romboutsia sp. 1001713B170207_170306_H8]|uniref:DNA polymerase III subunit beta n=1 Tax=Romboutsia sp. 1001713B170207_170306_H8 TaxID=2787112 RepID=UPI001897B6B8|nr:DNA polymerase III subunit beta [Romboutsia sp. 1001713B170207_170306_H8]